MLWPSLDLGPDRFTVTIAVDVWQGSIKSIPALVIGIFQRH
jgi:hypothetical protein